MAKLEECLTCEPLKKMEVLGFDINARAGSYTAQVYTKVGGYKGYETSPAAWNLVQSVPVTSEGHDAFTPLPGFSLKNPLVIPAGEVRAFYVKLDSLNMKYTNGIKEGKVYKQDENLQFMEGVGKANNGPDNTGFGSTYRPRVWNGRICYALS